MIKLLRSSELIYGKYSSAEYYARETVDGIGEKWSNFYKNGTWCYSFARLNVVRCCSTSRITLDFIQNRERSFPRQVHADHVIDNAGSVKQLRNNEHRLGKYVMKWSETGNFITILLLKSLRPLSGSCLPRLKTASLYGGGPWTIHFTDFTRSIVYYLWATATWGSMCIREELLQSHITLTIQ